MEKRNPKTPPEKIEAPMTKMQIPNIDENSLESELGITKKKYSL